MRSKEDSGMSGEYMAGLKTSEVFVLRGDDVVEFEGWPPARSKNLRKLYRI